MPDNRMKLNDLVIQEPRPMPVFLLLDTSASMKGEKIATLNASLRELCSDLTSVKDARGKIHLCVLTFGRQVEVIQPLAPVESFVLPELEAAGNTPMGEALLAAATLIEDRDVVSSRAYTPTIVLISDGKPNDVSKDEPLYEKIINDEASQEDYMQWTKLRQFNAYERVKKCFRLSLAIGADADIGMLKAYVNDDRLRVIKAREASGISRFFQWLTMSVSARSVSKNPNDAFEIPYDQLFEADELL